MPLGVISLSEQITRLGRVGVTLDFLPKVMSPTPWLFFKEGFEDALQVANR